MTRFFYIAVLDFDIALRLLDSLRYNTSSRQKSQLIFCVKSNLAIQPNRKKKGRKSELIPFKRKSYQLPITNKHNFED